MQVKSGSPTMKQKKKKNMDELPSVRGSQAVLRVHQISHQRDPYC